MSRRTYSLLVHLLLFLVFSSCVTQKKKDEKRSLVGRAYENTLAHYNGYFNAEELMKASLLRLEAQYQENYTKILPIYPYEAADNPQAVAQDMDKAIEKVSKVVALHRNSQWSDDCYLLVGKAQFLQQDYESAEKTLRYLITEFDPLEDLRAEARAKRLKKEGKENKAGKKKMSARKRAKEAKKRRKKYNKELKKRQRDRRNGKKVDTPADKKEAVLAAKQAKEEEVPQPITDPEADVELPDNYFLKHTPAHQEGQLWLARTLIQRDNYNPALRIMNTLAESPKTLPDIQRQLWPLFAYYYFERGEYQEAIQPLERAVEVANDRKDKARFAFIIAQLYQQSGQGAKAYAAFERVLKFSPNYDMEFSCRLNMAQNAWHQNAGSPDQAIANLEKLLKDDKNVDYQDQIFFAMARIYLEAGQREEAIAYFQKSLRANAGNQIQLTDSYLAMAELYFEAEAFVPAKNYLDSTLNVMSKDEERYASTQRLRDNLEDIARNLEAIQLKDSLLVLGERSDEELRQLAYEILQEQQAAERAALTQNPQALPVADNRRNLSTATPALQKESSFFAYDDRAIKRGKRVFQERWGNRTLQDNWRLSSYQSGIINAIEAAEEVQAAAPEAAEALTDEQLDELLEGIPRTQGDRLKLETEIAEAMFELGKLYREKLENTQKSIEILTELNRRFPRSNKELDSWYYLYLGHLDLNQTARAEEYKNKIIDRYSSSLYARVLLDPNYTEQLADRERSINYYYDEALAAFNAGDYQKAFDMTRQVSDKFPGDNPLQARFALLGALCSGNLQGEEAYKTALGEVIAKFPDTDEQRRAREILRFFGDTAAALPGGDEQAVEASFQLEDDQVHFVLIALNGEINLNEAKAKVSDYHNKYHKLDRLRISNIFLGNDPDSRIPMLIVRRFSNRDEAMKYFNGIQRNSRDFITSIPYEVFPITLNNYREILRAKSVSSYRQFFESNYLQ